VNSPRSLSTWLTGRGLTPQEADLWGDFIGDALDLLEEAHALLRLDEEWAAFMGGCHGSTPTEPEITSGLGDRMKRLRNAAPLESDRDRLQVSYEAPTPGDHAHGIRKSKADFRFDRKFEAGYAVAFVLEAKPLKTSGDMTSRYLGGDGLGCFTERTPPYSTDVAAGMVGYIKTARPDWLTLLATLIAGVSTTRRFDHITTRTRVALASDHCRTALTLSPVTVVHTLLDFV
jgi:hypothetical protein